MKEESSAADSGVGVPAPLERDCGGTEAPTTPCPGPVSRRGLIKHGIAASLAFTLGRRFIPRAWAAEDGGDSGPVIRRKDESDAYIAAPGRAQHVILLWMNGGPSHLDTFDPKPGTPQSDGLRAIEAAAGLQITANLPKLARQGRHLCVLRGVTSKEGDHGQASYLLKTGYREQPGVDFPSLGPIVCAEAKGGPACELPGYVALNGRGGRPGFYGSAYLPFSMRAGQAMENVVAPAPEKIIDQRRLLLDQIDRAYAERNGAPLALAHQQTYERAVRFARSPLAHIYEIADRDAARAAPYGKSPFGQACFIAKRLIAEANVRFVEIELDGWDTHSKSTEACGKLCETMDAPFARLLEELAADGLLSRTLIVWMGEFGRTPDVNGSGGRDHYPRSFNICLAGGGVLGGQAVGASNKSGHEPDKEAISVADFFHTVCAACGIDAAKMREAADGRPIRIAEKDSKLIPGVFG